MRTVHRFMRSKLLLPKFEKIKAKLVTGIVHARLYGDRYRLARKKLLLKNPRECTMERFHSSQFKIQDRSIK
jgi:hypothetical protein